MAKRTSRNGFYPSSFCPSLVSFLSPLFALWIRNVITVGKLGKGKRRDERTRIPRILATLLRRRSRFAILQSALSERYFCMEKEGFSRNVIPWEMEFESIAGTNKFWRVDLSLEIVLLVCRHVLRNLLKPPSISFDKNRRRRRIANRSVALNSRNWIPINKWISNIGYDQFILYSNETNYW